MTAAAYIIPAPPYAVCSACRQRCDGELVESAPGPDGEPWYLHLGIEGCEQALRAAALNPPSPPAATQKRET